MWRGTALERVNEKSERQAQVAKWSDATAEDLSRTLLIRNRSGFVKTSAVAVRPLLRDGLEHPSGDQTARTGLAASTAIRLYRAGLI